MGLESLFDPSSERWPWSEVGCARTGVPLESVKVRLRFLAGSSLVMSTGSGRASVLSVPLEAMMDGLMLCPGPGGCVLRRAQRGGSSLMCLCLWLVVFVVYIEFALLFCKLSGVKVKVV